MKLTSQYRALDEKLEAAKKELEKKLRQPIQEFLNETGVKVSSIFPDCLLTTAMGDADDSYVIGNIAIRTGREPH